MRPLPAPAERGASLVEMALLSPFLILLMVGIVDLGMVYSAAIGLEEAAQEGALYGALNPSDEPGIRMRAAESAAHPSLADTDVTVACPSASKITVTAEYDHDLITPFIGAWFGGTVHLERTVTATVYSTHACVATP